MQRVIVSISLTRNFCPHRHTFFSNSIREVERLAYPAEL